MSKPGTTRAYLPEGELARLTAATLTQAGHPATLKAAGYDAQLNVYTDDQCYDVTAEISATDPRTDAGAIVYVNDSPGLTWRRDYWHQRARTTWQPRYRTWLPDPRPPPATSPPPSPAPLPPPAQNPPPADASPARSGPAAKEPASSSP
jgi:hypothetical protein